MIVVLPVLAVVRMKRLLLQARNPGPDWPHMSGQDRKLTAVAGGAAVPDCAALHPGYACSQPSIHRLCKPAYAPAHLFLNG
jgi:hypothetical protein